MSNRLRLHDFNDAQSLADALSQKIAANLQEAIAAKGSASLIVSGGSTPKLLFKKLRSIDIAWDKINVGLCDERWVNALHEDSNERLVTTHLLQEYAAKAHFVGMYVEGLEAEQAEFTCKKNVQENLWPFDVVILGMGADAHTASLFPENAKLEQGFNLENDSVCIAIKPETAAHMRMSLTRAAILSASHLYLHFEGDEKRKVFETAQNGKDIHAMPIRSILHQDIKNVEVYFS
jgi:6-phosphogluconolactonase